jgi:hypothetical protein
MRLFHYYWFAGLALIACEPQDGYFLVETAPIGLTVTAASLTPTIAITSPASGSTLNGMASVQASVSDPQNVSSVDFLVDGVRFATVRSAPFVTNWDTHLVMNGSHSLTAVVHDRNYRTNTSAPVPITVAQPGAAEYDPGLGVPVCWGISSLCDSTALVQGRGPMGPEPHAPNTLDGCADGTHNEPDYHPEQIHWLRVSRADGRPFVAGRRIRVDIAVEVPNYSSGGPPTITLFSASDATAPVWTYLKAISFHPELYPEQRGFAVGSAEYVLPSGSLQAVRASFGPGSTWVTPCGTSSIEDRDDLVFAVGEEVDHTPPTVSFSAPANNAPVTTPATLTATADDDFNVTRVEFYDGGTLIGSDTTPPFSMEWHNALLPEGPRTLTAKAYDAAGNVSTPAAVSVIIDHTKPNVWISSPASDAFVRGTVPLTASASDANGIRAVSFYDGPLEYGYLIGYATAAPYTVNWNTLNTYNGRRGIRAVATDGAGNLSEAVVVGVTVDNEPPTVAITSPVNGGTVFLSTTIQAAASDNNAVTQVAFYDGSKLIGTDTTAPYSMNWSTLMVPKGQHTLTARATDVAGNVLSSAGVVVTVQ